VLIEEGDRLLRAFAGIGGSDQGGEGGRRGLGRRGGSGKPRCEGGGEGQQADVRMHGKKIPAESTA
jgi:hypothetical protein